MQDPYLDPDQLMCHRTAFKQSCKKHREHCGLWIKMCRRDVTTGLTIDDWLCGDTWKTILDAEIIQRLNEQGAAIESLRNELAAGQNALIQIGMQTLAPSIPSGNQHKIIDVTPEEV